MTATTLQLPTPKGNPAEEGFQVHHLLYGKIVIPHGIATLDDFIEWRQSDDLPEKLKAHYFQGVIVVETDMEEHNSHNRVKTALTVCLEPWLDAADLGHYVGDNMLLRNDAAQLSTEPDGMVLLDASMAQSRFRLESGETSDAQATIIVGTPDLVIEVVSPSSKKKDLKRLMRSYQLAGIPEYWIIDSRGSTILFQIHMLVNGAYQPLKNTDDWTRSVVLEHEFRFSRRTKPNGVMTYRLEMRS